MTGSTPTHAAPFRSLQRALIRRRLDAIEPRLRIELALIVLLIGGFVFWQARVPFDALARARGPAAVAVALAALGVLLALSGGAIAGSFHYRQLRRERPGPAWLSLPIPPHRIGRHLAWEARLHALWMALPVPPLLLAAAGLVPAWWLVLLAAVMVWMLLEAGRAGGAIAWRAALGAAEPRPELPPIVRLLATRTSAETGARWNAGGRWRRSPAWRALWSKDRLLAGRPAAARPRLIAPIVLGLLSMASWALVAPPIARPLAAQLGGPVTPGMAHLLAFALALLAAATLGEWLIALAGQDPYPVLRGLPVGAWTVWGSRMAWVAIATVLLVAGHAIAARPLSARALEVFLMWIGGATLVIGMLAVNYGVTLFPHDDAAQRIYALSLGLAIASSLMIPLMGWIVLLTAIVHSTRRLPRWSRLEP